MNVSELLERELDLHIKEICVNITTITDIYNLFFIEYEDNEKIGGYITHSDGKERFMIIYKSQIVALQVVYEEDIEILELTNDNEDVMVN